MTKFQLQAISNYLASTPEGRSALELAERINPAKRGKTKRGLEINPGFGGKELRASRQFWAECVSWATASGTAVVNSSTETVLFPNITIPANFMQDGRSLRVTAFGSYGTTSAPTLIYALRWGGVSGVTLCKTGAIVCASSAGSGASSLAIWTLQAAVTVRSNGSSGTAMANGMVSMYSSTVPTFGTATNLGMDAPMCNGGQTTPAVATCDWTADTALSLTAKWGTLDPANSIQGLNYYVEAMN